MDVTKLFEVPDDKLAPLPSARLDAMIENAVSQPQIQAPTKVPANQNSHFVKRAVAIAAVMAIVIAVSLQLSPQIAPVSGSTSSDAYDEISEMLILETLNDLS